MTTPDIRIWEGCVAHVRQNHPAISRQWFEELDAGKLENGILNVRVPQPVRLRYLQRECGDIFNEAAQVVTGRLIIVRFTDPDGRSRLDRQPEARDGAPVTRGGSAEHQITSPTTFNHAQNGDGAVLRGHPRTNGARHAGEYDSGSGGATWGAMYEDMVINPDYTFENFVQGPNNRLAYAAALAVSENPGYTYNPYFIHGGVGLGKTHLLQAICQTILQTRPEIRIYYVSCEGFASQLMEAVQAGQMAEFRHRFRDIEVLVVDDIHFLGGYEQTQEEFFHTFNTLYQAKKQIVLSSDAVPNDIPDIEERLLSRFNQGLVARLEKPTYETRVYILKMKARLRDIEVPDDVICYLANQIDSNIRVLEGALTKIQAQAGVANRPIDLELAREALGAHDSQDHLRIGIQDIIGVVSRQFDTNQRDLLSKKKRRSIVLPRQIAMYLARRHTDHSLQDIGGFLGGRDHTTVIHAIRKIEKTRANDDRLNQQITAIEDKLSTS